jgi:serine/threonine protein kinase
MRDWTGEHIGTYQVLRLLEQETLIDHYLAFDLVSQRQVALDLPALPTDEMGPALFQREMSILQRIPHHPSIVPLLEVGVQDGTPFVVLPHFPTGRELHPFPLPLSTVIHFVSHLTEALNFIHSWGVVHRALSPDTIFIGKQGEALLGGLHLPLLRSIQGPQQDPLLFPASPVYLPPEQISGFAVDTGTDQYALALVVYEWLGGMPPFQGTTPVEIAVQQIYASPPPLREKAPMLPLELELVIEKALAKLPEDRFATLNAFCSAMVEASQKTFDGPILPP